MGGAAAGCGCLLFGWAKNGAVAAAAAGVGFWGILMFVGSVEKKVVIRWEMDW